MALKQISFAFFLLSSIVAVARPVLSEREIKSKIKMYDKKSKRIERRLRSIEKDLEKKNSLYLRDQKKIQSVQSTLFEIQKEIQRDSNSIKLKIGKTKKVLASLIANSFSPEDAKVLMRKKVLINLLGKKILVLKNTKMKADLQSQTVLKLSMQVTQFQKKQTELTLILKDLEKDKSIFAKEYLSVSDNRNKLIEKRSLQRQSRTKKKRRVGRVSHKGLFSSPLGSYGSIEYKKKGITFKFRGRKAVVATSTGKIDYIGSLSTYGNVVMIDHGKGTRSILLGGFIPKVKKGDSVKKGDLLGYTRPRGDGKIYFEVRKKNKAQNTLVLMDKQFLTRNNIPQT